MDNSEYMRNGDFAPTRFEAQYDAVSMLFTAKTNANPESTVGFLTMAGRNVEVVASPTGEQAKLLSALHGLSLSGTSNVICLGTSYFHTEHSLAVLPCNQYH